MMVPDRLEEFSGFLVTSERIFCFYVMPTQVHVCGCDADVDMIPNYRDCTFLLFDRTTWMLTRLHERDGT